MHFPSDQHRTRTVLRACKIDPEKRVRLILFREIHTQKAIDNMNLYM